MAKMHPTAPASPMRLQQIPGVPDQPPGDPTPSPAPVPPGFPTDPGPEPAYPDLPSEAPPWSNTSDSGRKKRSPMPSEPPMEIPPMGD